MSDHFFVVTGGPGAGKTTLIEELARRGFLPVPESGRAIIRKEIQTGVNALSWADRIAHPTPRSPEAGLILLERRSADPMLPADISH